MYINPFERMKNLKLNTEETKPNNSKNNEQKMNSTQVVNGDKDMTVELFKNSGHEVKKNKNEEELGKIDGMVLSNYEIVRDLIKTFKEKNNEMQFFLTIVDNQHQDSMPEIVSSFFSMPLVNIDLLRIELYASPFLFLLKRIIKGLPKVSLEDKKVLWDRVKLFARTLKNNELSEQTNDSNSVVIINELEFDDPLEYIKKEFEEILRAYEIKDNIVIIFNNIDLVGYAKFKTVFSLVHAIFKGIIQFKFIVALNPVLIETYVKQIYGNNLTDQLIKHEISVFNKCYIIRDDDEGSSVEKVTSKVEEETQHSMQNFAPVEEEEDDDTIGFDYWAMRGGK
ncbi:hypothetical protein S100390_v1c00420 [Spiroplasma sp. NBRC 100390]|uniref:hypothetical protein n=1 Tax=unclassified Spiroplasma TaxID=2637901 RepID=UPI0008927F0F|nr:MULTISPECIES: hypothetical protein [unclassified Spiroplasma]AOX43385.1 hypothetical protein STU14_v1c00420 [Spiroplasma sp. TU-14]APE12855.1 hypothetical protein S100390_v1c00420 [Spiroplasma sp. NBRC 100390]